MLCEVCSKQEATVHYSETVNGKATEMHMCEKCASNKGIKVFPFDEPFVLGDLLSGLVESKEELSVEEKSVKEKCPLCSMTITEFKKTGLLGCAECYKTFKRSLTPLFRKIHGSTHHIGKFPIKIGTKSIDRREHELNKLRAELIKTVEEERFEDAAKLRDRIKLLETEIQKSSERNSGQSPERNSGKKNET